ncbi:MAG: transposase [Candidatus Omnitrophota bacterium]|nr:transposase [Candidatus Omnitrophota bacterium]
MPRVNRICYSGALYHVMQRGNDKKDIFIEDADKRHFLKLCRDVKEEFGYILYCYALMNNHFHMTIETPNATGISKIMQLIEGYYAIFFNKKYSRVGHLFQGRFKSILVEKDAYLLNLSRYVHLNPVKTGYVNLPNEYQWTSYGVYLGDRRDILVDTDLILNYFNDGLHREEAVDGYKNFVESGIDKIRSGEDWLNANIVQKRFLASIDFIKKFQKRGQTPFVLDGK